MGDEGGRPDRPKKAFIDQVFEDQSGRPPVPEDPTSAEDPDGRPQAADAPAASAEAAALPDADAVLGASETAEEAEAVEPGEPVVTLSVEDTALVHEAMKKSGLIWVSTPDAPRGRAFWHAWVDGVGYLLTGPGEQPDPGWTEDAPVSVVVRSKDTTERLVTLDAVVSRLNPDADDWEPASSALAAGRLNLRDAETAPQRWAAGTAVLYRLRLTGPLTEKPGAYSDQSHRAAPVPSPATTQGPKPWVLHRRGRAGRPLS